MSNAQQLRDLDLVSREVGGGVVLVDAEGAILARSEGAEGLLGGPAEFERRWAELREGLEAALRARPDSERELTLELGIGSGSERTCLFVRALRIGASGRAGYMAIFTERRALDALQVHLHLASQMRRLQTTYRHAAHDLRAPLNAIALNLDLIRQDMAEDTLPSRGGRRATRDRVGLLQREVTRLSRMLQVLLAQSGAPRDVPRVFGLRRLLRELIQLVTPQAERLGIHVALQVRDERLAVRAPRDHLKQAFLNLLMNAIEAMPRGGPIEVKLHANAGRAVVSIRDHGVGIPDRDLDRIVGMRSATKPGSSGIGLFTTRSAVESLGGSLTLQSTEGVGTTVRVELPLAVVDAATEVACSTS